MKTEPVTFLSGNPGIRINKFFASFAFENDQIDEQRVVMPDGAIIPLAVLQRCSDSVPLGRLIKRLGNMQKGSM